MKRDKIICNEVLTIIPAKRRSTRLPNKNIKLLGGKPLLVHTVEQAIYSNVCGEICVATDDEYIAEIAKFAGASVPFFREGDSDDITPVGSACYNFLKKYQALSHKTFKYVCILLVTSPLRRPEDIRQCKEILLSNEGLDAVMSIVYAEKHPVWAWQFISKDEISPMFPDKCDLGKHQLPKAYYVDGSVYWAKVDFFESIQGNQYSGRVGGYIMPPERAIDIDTEMDFLFCEFLAQYKTTLNNIS